MENIKELIENYEKYWTNEIQDLFIYLKEYSQGYICDIIAEISDNSIDVYKYDLWNFARDNQDYIEDAVREFGIDEKNFDLIRLFQSGEYLYYSELFYENLEELIKTRCLYYILEELEIEEITEDKKEEFDELEFDNNNKELDELLDEVKSIFENDEE